MAQPKSILALPKELRDLVYESLFQDATLIATHNPVNSKQPWSFASMDAQGKDMAEGIAELLYFDDKLAGEFSYGRRRASAVSIHLAPPEVISSLLEDHSHRLSWVKQLKLAPTLSVCPSHRFRGVNSANNDKGPMAQSRDVCAQFHCDEQAQLLCMSIANHTKIDTISLDLGALNLQGKLWDHFDERPVVVFVARMLEMVITRKVKCVCLRFSPYPKPGWEWDSIRILDLLERWRSRDYLSPPTLFGLIEQGCQGLGYPGFVLKDLMPGACAEAGYAGLAFGELELRLCESSSSSDLV